MAAPGVSSEPTTGVSGWPPVSYWVRVTAIVIAIVVGLQALRILQNVLLVLLASFVLALGLQPAVDRLERRKWSRGTAVAAILVGALLPIIGLLVLVVPLITTQAAAFVTEIPDQLMALRDTSSLVAEIDRRIDLERVLTSLPESAQSALPDMLRSGAGFLFNLITVMVLTPYFAVAMPGLRRWIVRLLDRPTRVDVLRVLSESSSLVSHYIAGNLFISLIAFVVSLVGAWLIGVPYPVAVAAWIALTDLIPVVGAALGAAIAVLVGMFAGPVEAVAIGVYLTIYQQLENYVIAPRVMRHAVNVTPPMVIVALMVGGSLAGFVGALLALPIAAMTKVVVTEFFVRPRMEHVRARNAAVQADLATLAPKPELGRRPLP